MDASSIRDQVDKILHSQSFASKGQLRKLLEVLRDNMDSQAALTTERVIQELWPAEIKTKQARDVATEMNRLRRAVESYYDAEGEDDPVIVYFPKRAPSANENHESRWIDAVLRNDTGAGKPVQPVSQTRLQPTRSPSFTGRLRARKKLALMAAACLAVGIVVSVFQFVLATPRQPQSARLDGTALRIMDADGRELWSKNFPRGFGPDLYYQEEWFGRHIWFADLEGKGHTSVLFSYSPAGAILQPFSTTLICYSDRGKEKWRWTPGRDLPELNGSPATFATLALGILKATNHSPTRIVVSNQHNPWWPAQIAILDSNGKAISEYWHSGALSYMTVADLDGDGREEIIAAGTTTSGDGHRATLVVLDPDRVFGASAETQPEYQIHGMGAAQERLRLLFPRSDLNQALFQYNYATNPSFEHGVLQLKVKECITPPPSLGCPIWYEFDNKFRLIAAYAGSDEFRSEHNKFFRTGKNAHTLSAEEQAAFQKVRCLVGCKSEFVSVGKLVP